MQLVYKNAPRPVGLGIKVVKETGAGAAKHWMVVRLVAGFAAHKSGLVRVGDALVALDRRRLDDLTEDDIAKIMCGNEGSACLLNLLRQDADGATKTVTVRL